MPLRDDDLLTYDRNWRQDHLELTGDNHVNEAGAASIGGLSPYTLRNTRLTGYLIPYQRFGQPHY